MSIYTTVRITRSEAEEKFIRAHVGKIGISNEELGMELDRLFSDKTLNNYIVVDDETYMEKEDGCHD